LLGHYLLIANLWSNLITLGWISFNWSGLTTLIIVRRREQAPFTMLKELEFFVSKRSEIGLNIFLRSNLLGYFRIIRERQRSAFLRTFAAVLLERARSKTESDKLVNADGMLVASIESANDWKASFLDRISDSTEYWMLFQISSLVSGMMSPVAIYPVYFSSYLAELMSAEAYWNPKSTSYPRIWMYNNFQTYFLRW